MLWLVGVLLAAAWGVLWWRFGATTTSAAHTAPPALAGNHPSLATRHYRLADFRPAPVAPAAPPSEVPPVAADEPLSPEAPAPPAADAAPPAPATEAAPAPGELPAGSLHNYLTAPAPTANDEHNRGVELTAAQRRAKMRELMSQAAENRQPAA